MAPGAAAVRVSAGEHGNATWFAAPVPASGGEKAEAVFVAVEEEDVRTAGHGTSRKRIANLNPGRFTGSSLRPGFRIEKPLFHNFVTEACNRLLDLWL